MSKRMYSNEQINELLKNINILRCSNKVITYHKDFKIEAIKQYYHEKLSPQQIFRKAGFNIDIIGRKTPKNCLQSWKKVFAKKGTVGLSEGTRGGGVRHSFKKLTDKEKIKYLEMKVAYLKAENSFLVKLRAKQKR